MRSLLLGSLVLAGTVASSPALAQTPVFSAEHVGWYSWGTLNGWDEGIDPDGNIDVIYSGSPDATPYGTPGVPGVVHVVEFDGETGAERFHVEIPSSLGGLSYGGGVVDGSGNVYVLTHNRVAPFGASLMKIDGSTGDLLWERILTDAKSTSSYTGYDIMIDSQGRVVTSVSSGYTLSPGYGKTFGMFDCYRPNGTRAWHAIDESGSSFGLAAGLSGDVYAVGRTYGDGTNDWQGNMVALRFTSNGTRAWAVLVDNNNQKDVGERAVVDGAGDLIAVGTSYDAARPMAQLLTRKLRRSNGATRWTRVVDTGSASTWYSSGDAFRATSTANGDIVIGAATPLVPSFFVRLSGGAGQVLWTQTDTMSFYDLEIDPDGDVLSVHSQSAAQKINKLAGATGALVWSTAPPLSAIYNELAIDSYSGRVFAAGYGLRTVSTEPLVREGLVRVFAVE